MLTHRSHGKIIFHILAAITVFIITTVLPYGALAQETTLPQRNEHQAGFADVLSPRTNLL